MFWIEGIGFGEVKEWFERLEQEEEGSDTCIAHSPKQEAMSLMVERERVWRFVFSIWACCEEKRRD